VGSCGGLVLSCLAIHVLFCFGLSCLVVVLSCLWLVLWLSCIVLFCGGLVVVLSFILFWLVLYLSCSCLVVFLSCGCLVFPRLSCLVLACLVL
jgi:hypothetical protein